MPGLNTTGLPQTGDYNLGRGVLYAGTLTGGTGLPKEYFDLGNATEFNLSVETEKLEHQSSRQGLKVVDKEATVSQKVSLSFTLDEINFQNLASFFQGTTASHTNVAVAGFAEWTMIPAPGVVLGRWYDIVNTAGNRAYDIESANLTVKNGTTNAVLVLNTDYTLDLTMGRIFFLSTATGIAAGVTVKVTLAADVGAVGVDEVKTLTQTSSAVALKFISQNPANSDKKTEYQFHKVTLKAEGDLALIGDEWTTMPFTAVAEANEAADSDSPYLTIRYPKVA